MHIRILLVCICLTCAAYGEPPLSGGIGGMTFDTMGNPYIVTGTITVERGTTAEIKAGCIFLFNRFCGMIVDGNLDVKGTANNPVVFTSSNDGDYARTPAQSPQPYDWNGILIAENVERISMSNFILAYSVYGLKSGSSLEYAPV